MEIISGKDWMRYVDCSDEEKQIIHVTAINGDFNILVTPWMSYERRSKMIGEIIRLCTDNNGYHPATLDIVYGFYMISCFTDLDCGGDVSNVADLIYCSDIITQIESTVCPYVGNIKEDIAREVKYQTSCVEKLCRNISDGIESVSDYTFDDLTKLLRVNDYGK